MDNSYEATYHALEQYHWWFRARREMVSSLVQSYAKDGEASILEIGCSGGELLSQLAALGYTNLYGIDISDTAVAACRQKGLDMVHVMDAKKLVFDDNTFDMLTASDILEHMEDDTGSLHEWHRVLKKNGRLILFVPAFQLLWSYHDVVNHHHRRYAKRELLDAVHRAGFTVERYSYWNVLLFFPITLARLASRFRFRTIKKKNGNLYHLHPGINACLFLFLRIENWLLQKARAPFGVSLFLVAKKRV